MDKFVIQKLTEEYVSQVFEIEKKLIGSGSVEDIMKTFSSKTLSYYVMLFGEEVVGFFEMSVIKPEVELFDIAVKEEFQGKGCANELMKFFMEQVKNQNCDTILLEVNSINKKAIALYEKFGFVSYGLRKNYYGENDAVLMKKMI